MKVTVEKLANGFLINDEEGQASVYQYKNEEEDICLDALKETVYDILERLGYFGSKHHARRLFVKIINQLDKEGEIANEPDKGDNIQGD
jgi:hypothetical protein